MFFCFDDRSRKCRVGLESVRDKRVLRESICTVQMRLHCSYIDDNSNPLGQGLCERTTSHELLFVDSYRLDTSQDVSSWGLDGFVPNTRSRLCSTQ